MTETIDAATATRLPLYGLLSGYLVSALGTAMSALAIPWLVLTTTGSAGRTGVVGFAEMAPYVLLQATAGPLVDRIGARRTCVIGNLAAALAVCVIPALYAGGGGRLGVLIGLVAVAGALRGLADVACNPLVPGAAALGAVGSERAAGLYSGANRAGPLIGAPLAGILVAAAGAPLVVLVDGLTFAVAAVIIAGGVPVAAQPPIQADHPLTVVGYLRQLGAGMRFLRCDRLLLGIVTMVAVTNLLDQALTSVLLPVWVRDRLHTPAALGFLGGAAAVGALLGILAGAWIGHRLPRRTTYAWGFLVAGAPLFLAPALLPALSPVLAIYLICGLAGGSVNPIIGALQYERIPAQLQARVLGSVKASAWVGIPFGSLLGGALTDAAGLRTALLACGAAMLLATLAPFVFPAWRDMNRTAPEPSPASPGMSHVPADIAS